MLQPGVVYMDAQMTKMLAKQEELLAGQRQQGADIAELKQMLSDLAAACATTAATVATLRDDVVAPLHNVMQETAEATLATVAHFSGDKIVSKAIHDMVPALTSTVAEVVAKSVEDQLAASQVLQDLELALKHGGGFGARWGLTDIARHVIQRTCQPSCLEYNGIS